MKLRRTLALALMMLVTIGSVTGGTIAWFTDSVTSANNVIQAGTLDVDVYYGDATAKNRKSSREKVCSRIFFSRAIAFFSSYAASAFSIRERISPIPSILEAILSG